MAGGNWLFNLMYFFLAVYPFALDFDVLYIRKKKKNITTFKQRLYGADVFHSILQNNNKNKLKIKMAAY